MAQRKKKKFYVVWKGRATGVFDTWADCQHQIEGFGGAEYKSFSSRAEAERAFAQDSGEHIGKTRPGDASKKKPKAGSAAKGGAVTEPVVPSLAVDAACSKNVGPLEYQGVLTDTGVTVFHAGPFADGTNNVGEFLAIVHGLAYLQQEGLSLPIYSDSRVAIGWVRGGKANTTLDRTGRNDKLFELLARATHWLAKNTYDTPILKWETRQWGEIPADFGRK